MNNTIFDLVESEIPEGKEGYFEIAKRAPEPKDSSFLDSIKDYAKTALKGTVEGVSRLGLLMGPLQTGIPQEKQLEQQTEALDILLPTEDTFGQRALRRGLKQTPSVISFPGSIAQALPRSIASGFLGEGAKDFGAPEWAQTAAEMTAYIGPDITKKLLEKGKNSELIKAARELGISDEALTPLLQSNFRQKWLSKLTPRRGATEKSLSESKKELSRSYEKISKSELAKKNLSQESTEKIVENIDDKLFKMPSGVRDKIKKDYQDLLSKPMTGESLINFWTDINHAIGKDSKQLSLLKDPIRNALKEISPKMAKDFETVNALYSKYYPIASKLAPNLKTDIVSAASALGLLGGVITGNYQLLAQFTTPYILGKLSQQMLINPRFQQLSRKIVSAINENKFTLAKKTSEMIAKEVKKLDPDTAKEIEKLSEEDFRELIKSHH